MPQTRAILALMRLDFLSAFASYDRHQIATDNQGGQWKVEEDSLVGPGGKTLKRVSAHRAFWFGWYSAHPGTRLVH